MIAEAMFISSLDLDHEISGDPGLGEISGGRLAEPHAFPWYLLIPVLNKSQLLTISRLTRSSLRYDVPLQTRNFSI